MKSHRLLHTSKGGDNLKPNRGYATAAVLTQMLLVPIILTIMLIGILSIPGLDLRGLPTFNLGKDALNLITALVAFVVALMTGGFVGFVFSKSCKNKPNTSKARYLPILIPTAYAFIFACVAVAFAKGNYNSSWWGIYLLKNPVFFIFYIAASFSGLHFAYPIVELMGYIGFALGFLIYELKSNVLIRNEISKKLIITFSVLCVAVVLLSAINTSDIISNGMIEIMYGKSTVGNDLTEYDLNNIAPFKENNGLAKLDKPASLQFTDIEKTPRLDGATAAYPVYAAFVQATYKGLGDYYEANKNSNGKDIYTAFVESSDYPLNIVKCTKTSGAYERLINGDVDIIFVAEPSKGHNEAIKAKGNEFRLTPIGSEAFIFFTNIKNPVENLTIKQIQEIYSGRISNWKEVGGENRKILPYQRPEDSGSQTIMLSKVMKDAKMVEPTKETYAGGMGDIISRVAGYKNAKNAIGYSFMYYSTSMIKNNQIKYIAVDGIKPSRETVQTGTYPFTVPVYAVTLKSNTNENVSKLIEWILSEEGQSLVEKTGYTPVK